ncbi:hypothetical protein PCANB_001233 [Pneumocystis canis]|nr:hypothetical protein PCK1_001199 [Pneumocystis canis]KAG5437112.1 hypothetical protein PCANB_001233 [Pneumocystis canis]
METYNKNQEENCNEIPNRTYGIGEGVSLSITSLTNPETNENSIISSTHLLHENNTTKDNFTSSHTVNKELNTSERNVNNVPKSSIRSFASRFSSRYTSRFHENDGVFANLNAKPDISKEKIEEFPPSYEQAAADATPSYWENTIIAPSISEDDVFIDGLPVGGIFGFLWNMLISFSFQFIGFLLTYLLHTTYAAKNGSKAGLGITLVQYGFYMRTIKDNVFNEDIHEDMPDTTPEDDSQGYQNDSLDHIIISYLLMIAGWFLLFRSTAEFLKARRIEMCVRETSTPSNTSQTIQNEIPEISV